MSQYQGAQPQSWKNSFWSCFEPIDACLLGTFCPCLLYGRVTERLKYPDQKDPSFFNGSCAGWAGLTFCCGCGWIMQLMTRGEVRRKFNLEGNGCTDCLAAACCTCCDLVQMDKEVAERQNLLPVTSQPEKSPAGMNYGAPQQPASTYDPYMASPGMQQPGQQPIQYHSEAPIQHHVEAPSQHMNSNPAYAMPDRKDVASPPAGY